MKVIVLDTETSGLNPNTSKIIELAALVIDTELGFPTGERFYSRFNPEQPIEPESQAIHGLSWEMLEHEPIFADKAEELIHFLAGNVVVIHNAPFDKRMLDKEFTRLNRPSVFNVVAEVQDTLSISRRFSRSMAHDIDSLCRYHGIQVDKRENHSALQDCELLALLYPYIIEEKANLEARIETLLPFKMGDSIPECTGELIKRALYLAELSSNLERENKRYREEVMSRLQGVNFENKEVSASFSTRTSTKWSELVKSLTTDEKLQELKPKFTSSSDSMTLSFV